MGKESILGQTERNTMVNTKMTSGMDTGSCIIAQNKSIAVSGRTDRNMAREHMSQLSKKRMESG
jgi:hypothetical protein